MAQSLQRTMIRRQAIPIRTVCAWCATQNRPAAVLVDVPLDSRGMSHGICPSCRSVLTSDSLATLSRPTGLTRRATRKVTPSIDRPMTAIVTGV